MRQGRKDGFREFAVGRSGPLYRSACLLASGDVHLAEDLVQETLGRMYLLWGRISRIDNPAAYAQTVLVRSFLTHQRRRSAGERPVGEFPESGTPEAGAADPELRVTLRQAGDGFTPDRQALVAGGERRGRRLVVRRRAAVIGGSVLGLALIGSAGAYTVGLLGASGSVGRRTSWPRRPCRAPRQRRGCRGTARVPSPTARWSRGSGSCCPTGS